MRKRLDELRRQRDRRRGDLLALLGRDGRSGSLLEHLLVPALGGAVTLEEVYDVAVPVENRLGAEGEGFKIVMRALQSGRINVGSMALGIARACFEDAVQYAKDRVVRGQPLGRYQMIQSDIAEMAVALDREWRTGRDRMSPSLQAQLDRGHAISATDHQHALAQRPRAAAALDVVFSCYDAILTPATTGTAPPWDSTGDPAFGTLWSLCGVPAISLPLLHGDDGLPLGVQWVGAPGSDAALLRTARWLEARLRRI